MARPPFSLPFSSPLLGPLLSSVNEELLSDSTPMQHQSLPSLPQNLAAPSHVKGEPLDLSVVPLIQQQGAVEQQGTQDQQGAEEPGEAPFLKSIVQLSNLSTVINEFNRRFDDLRKHLDFIQTSIDAHYDVPQQGQSAPTMAPPPMSNSTAKQASTEAAITKAEAATTMPITSPAPPKSELMILCETMCGRGLRKYLTSNLSNIRELRAEVPPALQCAPQPAKLVLDCIGRFYLQGIRAYTKNSPMITGRKASILILEFFLLMINNDVQFDSAVRQEADQAAIAWRKRLISEGGISKACEADAKGLLLFVACYGIPKVFSNENVWDLVRLSNSKQIADALRRSHVLVKRISDILERMLSNGMKIEAVDVVCTFGIEDKFPPQKLLSSYLRDTKEALKRRNRDANKSPTLLKEASERQLATLKSVVKFLDDRKLDPVKLLSGWQIREKVDMLEKDIADLNKKIDERVAAKRKADENEFLNNLKNQEAKRLRFNASPIVSSPSLGLHEQRVPPLVDGNGVYGASMRLNFSDGGFSGRINNPIVGSMLHSSSSFPAAYGAPSATSYAGAPSATSYAGVRGEMLVDRTGQIIGNSGLSYERHGVVDASVIDGSVRRSFVYEPASGLFVPSAVEGFAVLPNSSPAPANRSSSSDLYRFADAVK